MREREKGGENRERGEEEKAEAAFSEEEGTERE